MIRLEDISVRIQGTSVVANVNLEIIAGEGIVIRGANGSGKTALLEIIAGMRTASEGKVAYDFISDDLSWDEKFHLRRRFIHYVPALALHEFLGNVPDLYYQQRYYSIGEGHFRTVASYFGSDIERLPELHLPPSFDLDALMNLDVNRLSNGQIRKLIIVRQLLREIPKVLILDYPFEGLDRKSRRELVNFLDFLVERHNIALVITDHHHELPRCVQRELKLGPKETNANTNEGNSDTIKITLEVVGPAPVVEMRDVTIQYESRKIIENFNWTVHQGERWALTGPNGSGKTTLFSLIYADHPLAYSQDVSLFGRRRGTGESIWDIKNRINYLGPEQSHYMTDGGVLVLSYLKQHNSNDNTALDSLIDYFNIRKLAERRLRTLSHGELQIVQLIRFFLSRKELLLLDEPFQFLDDQTKQKVILYLNSYLERDTTLILITHYEEDLVRWTNHVMDLTPGN